MQVSRYFVSLSAFSIALLASFLSAAWSSTPSLIEEGNHCVAYRAKRVMFFVRSDQIIGKNCEISAQVLPEVGGLYHLEVNVPVRAFRSGVVERDADVMKMLKEKERPELTFRSGSYSAEEWKKLFAQGEFELNGMISIGQKEYPLKVPLRYIDKGETSEVDGWVVVKFQDFEIRPPKALGGIVATTKSDLELHFHLVSQRILGVDSIRWTKEASETKEKKEQVKP